ncbi:hypothetical protein HX875_16745 [Pseudomonas yamanorum]|uniref:hypothetical protein n=1 Tax=Pseudomonas yamanorum TaxID=515393 RepID=UPI0015A27CFD|nr:hypothetical protein [Pseudomonas yamanorum]NWE41122.1 hypothetical protein [Pseudomonas yamanorum]
MKTIFNLTGLTNIYRESLQRSEPTLAFEINQGKGRLVFMMFFSKEDKSSKDNIFVFLRNTKTFLKLKAYGSHKNGDFQIYFEDSDQLAIINELMLEQGGSAFDFRKFLETLNLKIPTQLPLQAKLDKIREVWPQVNCHLKETVDEVKKTNLIGIKKLPTEKNPKDKTLRKLYIHTNGNADTITKLISALKEKNFTLAWTDKNIESISFAQLMSKINACQI